MYAWNKTLIYNLSSSTPYLQLTQDLCDLFPAICCHGKIPEISRMIHVTRSTASTWQQALVVNNPRSCKTRGLIPFGRDPNNPTNSRLPSQAPSANSKLYFPRLFPLARGCKGHRQPRSICQRIRVPCRSNSLSWSSWISEAFLQVMDLSKRFTATVPSLDGYTYSHGIDVCEVVLLFPQYSNNIIQIHTHTHMCIIVYILIYTIICVMYIISIHIISYLVYIHFFQHSYLGSSHTPTFKSFHACTSGHPQQISFACALARGWNLNLQILKKRINIYTLKD